MWNIVCRSLIRISRVVLLWGWGGLVLSGCSASLVSTSPIQSVSNESLSLPTAYDYQLMDGELSPFTLSSTLAQLQQADVVFIGEFHGNQASHLLQMQVLAGLHRDNDQNNRATILSMEMFNRDQARVLTDYLTGKVGERFLIEETPTWKNYAGSYRPLVEYAKQHDISVVAANAAADIVRCIGRVGEEYLSRLSPEETRWIAAEPFSPVAGYEEKFMSLMGGSDHMPKNVQRRSYLGQLTRDNTMAESIVQALDDQSGAQVIHLNGSFHSEERLGTVGALKRMRPNLKLMVITPVHLNTLSELQGISRVDDFYYVVNPQPEEFVDDEYRQKTHRAMFKKSREKAQACKS